MPPTDTDVKQQAPPADGERIPVYARWSGHRVFYPAALSLVSISAVLIWFSVSADLPHRLDLLIALATIIFAVMLLIAFRLLGRDTHVKELLRGELHDSKDTGFGLSLELHNLNTGYRFLFTANPIPMWIFDLETLRFVEVNDAAVEHYGYTRDEFLGMTIYGIRDAAGAASLRAALEKPEPGAEPAGTWQHRKKDGGLIYVHTTSRDLLWRGVPSRFVCATDITERLRVEHDTVATNLNLESLVQSRTGRLHQRKVELEAINTELKSFSQSASHDLRTPLYVISTFTQLLIKGHGGELTKEGMDYLSKIEAGCAWMKSLIDSLLTLADVSQHHRKRTAVDLSALADEVIAMYRLKEPGRQVAVHVRPGITVKADYRLLRIALENLIGNAWKFTAKTLHPKIEIGTLQQGDEEVIFVRDNGAGFDMQAAGKLFHTFQRLHSDSEFVGHGIGLSTVQRIIKRHAGRIWAEAAVDKGATFFFTLGRKKGDTTIPYRPAGRDKPAIVKTA